MWPREYITASKYETNRTGFKRQLYPLRSPHPTLEKMASSLVRREAESVLTLDPFLKWSLLIKWSRAQSSKGAENVSGGVHSRMVTRPGLRYSRLSYAQNDPGKGVSLVLWLTES